jgi:hypothetical protein
MKATRHTRYLPTVYVDNAMSTRLAEGSLVLQPGQWIVLAWGGNRRARWAGVSSAGTLAVQHWEPGACYCSGTWTRHGGYCPKKWKAIRDFARVTPTTTTKETR